MRLHPKIEEFKKRFGIAPMSYVEVDIRKMQESGKLAESKSLLDKRIVEGYGVTWGTRNSHGEKFLKGSWSKSINDNGPSSNSSYKIKFRDEHGRSSALFETLKEDDFGLYFKTMPLDDVPWANQQLTQIRSGTINNFSIGFKPNWNTAQWDDAEDCIVYPEVRGFEISSVSIPSDMETYAVRTAEQVSFLQDEIEDFIQSLPRPNQLEARKIITRCMSLGQFEPQERNQPALDIPQPQKVGLDLDYLINNFKL